MNPNELMSSVSVEDLVKNAFCLSVDRRRRDNFTRIFSKLFGVVPRFFDGYTDNPNGRINCNVSHMAMIKMAKAMDMPYITIFEDDAFPRPDAKYLLEECMKHVPGDAAMVLWGFGNSPGNLPVVNEYMQRAEKPDYLWGSHAYTIFKSGYDKYSELYPRAADQYWGLVGPTYASTNCFIQFSSEDGVPNTPYFCSMKDLLEVDVAGDI